MERLLIAAWTLIGCVEFASSGLPLHQNWGFLQSGLLEYLEISSPIYLCKWALSNKLDYKDFFKRNNKTIIVKTDLEVSFNFSHEAVFCVDDINRFSTSRELFNSKKVAILFILNEPAEDILDNPDLVIDIDRRVYFYVINTREAWESYYFKGRRVKTRIGQVNEHFDGSCQFIPDNPSTLNFIERRGNFLGAELKIVIEDQPPYLAFKPYNKPLQTNPDQDNYHIESDLVHGMFVDIMTTISQKLNFTWTYYRRFDEEWGNYHPEMENPTNGMVKSVTEDDIDLIGCSMTISSSRSMVLDFLIPLGRETHCIYIRNPDTESYNLDLFIKPFTLSLWKFLLLVAALLALIMRLLEWTYEWKADKGLFERPQKIIFHSWVVFKSYFGGKPTDPLDPKMPGLRVLIFSILLCGNIVFMSYRASITSELAVGKIAMPFDNLESLSKSDYRLIVNEGGIQAQSFSNSDDKEGFYHKIYEAKMKPYGRDAYVKSIKKGFEKLRANDKLAYYNTVEGAEHDCSISTAWITDFPALLSMATVKDSPLKPFLNYAILKLYTNGMVPVIAARWHKEGPECKRGTVHSLGFSKILSLFLMVAMGMALAVLTFIVEFIWSFLDPRMLNSGKSRKLESDRETRELLKGIQKMLESPESDTTLQKLENALQKLKIHKIKANFSSPPLH